MPAGMTCERRIEEAAAAVLDGLDLSRDELLAIARVADDHLPLLCSAASRVRDAGKGRVVTFSPKVFIPLTQLCRDECGYCTFRKEPEQWGKYYLTPEEVLAIARAGERAGCREALFTLGERPEQKYPGAKEWLRQRGYRSTIDYLAAMCRLVLEETALTPHSNPGTLSITEMRKLQDVNGSMGLMLESVSLNLMRPGGPHEHSPSKHPTARIKTLEHAGELGIPFTTGLLLGLGDTLEDQLNGLLTIRKLHRQYGHIQEIIIQNFRAKPRTRMADEPEPGRDAVMRMAALARLVFGPRMNIQVPPNLTGDYGPYLQAGINDWGGISPLTPDHVNPECPWPHIADLRAMTNRYGFQLRGRYPVYPEFLRTPPSGLSREVLSRLRADADGEGYIPTAKESW